MTPNQQRFCDEYLIDGNATRAYKTAYPRVKNENVASAAGARLLRNVKVKEYIDKRLAEINSAKIASAEEVIRYLTSVMRGETVSEVVVVTFIGEGMSVAKRVEKSPDEKERLKAAELLGKRYGIFTDNMNINADMGVRIVDDVPDNGTD